MHFVTTDRTRVMLTVLRETGKCGLPVSLSYFCLSAWCGIQKKHEVTCHVCVRLYQDSLCVNGSVGACVRVRVCAIKKVCVHVCGICLYYLKCAFFLHVCV